MNEPRTFAEWLTWTREEHGYSKNALAQASGVDRSHLFKMEKGTITEPADDTRQITTIIVETMELELTREFRKAATAAERIIALFARPEVAVATVDVTGLDEVKALAARVKRLTRLVKAHYAGVYDDLEIYPHMMQDDEKRAVEEYIAARDECIEHGDLDESANARA